MFGVVNTWQFARVLMKGKLEQLEQFTKWSFYSQVYVILSLTAKVFLEVGFVWFVYMSRTCPLSKDSMVVHCTMSSCQQFWAVQNK